MDYGALNGRALSLSDRPLRRRFFGSGAVFLPRTRRLGDWRGQPCAWGALLPSGNGPSLCISPWSVSLQRVGSVTTFTL
jgi:hypothetical protein